MKVSLEWLKRYVDIKEAPEVLARDLTMFGLNVEEFHSLFPPLKGIVYGKVLDVRKHPKADRLSLCRVDVGGEKILDIICGAQNVREGLGVPVALHGTVLPGGMKIKRTRIRGEVSEGMICSEIELGIGRDAEGIIELDFEEKPGAGIEERLGSSDYIFDIEVTPNRPDQLCHVGVAREIAALYRRPLRMPECMTLETGAEYRLVIENGNDCPRYSAAFIDDVATGPSPGWMQDLLLAAGMKPINNIVDVTNFVLLELGQPLHAFDRDRLAKDMIVVRRAKNGDALVTLDDIERELDGRDLVIADADKPVGLAGVIGGRDSEVTDSTRRILLESAMFNPRLVRQTRQHMKIETEASYRFEREGDIGITVAALERACLLIKEIGAGCPALFHADILADPALVGKRKITMRTRQVNRVMGTHLSARETVSLLERLEIKSEISGRDVIASVPSFRRDIKAEIDLIEEAARVYGYENIGREDQSGCNIFSHISGDDKRIETVCNYLVSRGFAEVITSTFMDPGDPVRMGWLERDPRCNAIRIENPLTEAQSVLRTSLLPGMLNVARRNSLSEREGIKIFEMGKVFIPAAGEAGLPNEEMHITAIFTRSVRPLNWFGKQRSFDYFDMKGELEALLGRLGISQEIVLAGGGEGTHQFVCNWLLDSKLIAEAGVLPSSVARIYDSEHQVFYFDLWIDDLPRAGRDRKRYRQIIPYPAVKRDLCVIAADRVMFADIRNVVKREAKLLEKIWLFDYYRGGHLGEGKRSYTFRLSFRSSKGTLDDSTVDREIGRILTALQRELEVVLREE